MNDGLAIALAALKRIAECVDAPDIDATGEWQVGLHCGVEDRDCRDRYDGADYGHAVGVEKGLEWASNEAKHALELMANVPVFMLEPQEVKRLAMELNSATLYNCVMLYETGRYSWTEAMQIGAIELAKVAAQQQAELVRLINLMPAPVMVSNDLAKPPGAALCDRSA